MEGMSVFVQVKHLPGALPLPRRWDTSVYTTLAAIKGGEAEANLILCSHLFWVFAACLVTVTTVRDLKTAHYNLKKVSNGRNGNHPCNA
jgi:hypothetical protein